MTVDVLGDALATAISLAFLVVLGVITGVALPGLFIAAVAPWLDRLLPIRDKRR